MGNLDEARLSMNRAIEIQPGYASAYSRMGELMADMGDLPAKLDWARKAVEVDPQDHELAADVAINFYALGMAEEGDRWANRVAALAPDSDVARMTQLHGFVSHRDLEAAEIASRSMISDQVTARQGAIWDATFIFHQLVSNADRDNEGLEFLESVRPDIADFSVLPKDEQGTAMQWVAILFAHRALGPEEGQKRWSQFSANVQASGSGWQDDDPGFALTGSLLDGDIDSAVKIALDSLSDPVAVWIGQSASYQIPAFEPLLSDPRIIARMAERDRELQQAKRDVQTMLQGEEW
jgi:tetratricopeptide (TPR) repeat protein